MKKTTSALPIAIVGSVGIDTIETPSDRRVGILGGSASYACVAASYFAKTGMVGVVGTDFPKAYSKLFTSSGVDIAGLQVVPGETFRWSGVYEQNMDHRRTISTELGVFASFSPELPEAYRASPYVFLANIHPALQLHVLAQTKKPKFVLLDTMDLWINTARDTLTEVMKKVTMITINESEARHYTGEHTLIKAARKLLSHGPKFVVIKRGENGSMLFTKKNISLIPAYPLENLTDPTGAGDTFAGAFIGSLAENDLLTEHAVRSAMVYGSVVASFGCEGFSLDRLKKLTRREIEKRAALFRKMAHVP
jgi:cytidine kinase